MRNETKNDLALRLLKYATLSNVEMMALETLEGESASRASRASVLDDSKPKNPIAIVRQRWAVSKISSGTNANTIAQIYRAGDMAGLTNIGFTSPPHHIVMRTSGAVSVVSPERLFALSAEHPRLRAMIFAFEQP
jgi:hypothetical protein